MRIVCVLVLTCAFPFIALSQIQPDKAILADYAHPAFVQLLNASEKKIIIHEQHQVYLAASHSPEVYYQPQNGFTLVRQLSPLHAIIRIDPKELAQSKSSFQYLLPANNAWKLSPALLKESRSGTTPLQLVVAVQNI